MPQIAQQDYIKAVATPGREPQKDCNVLSVLAKALEAGTLFDVIIVYDDGGDLCQSKIIGRDGEMLYIFDCVNAEIISFTDNYTPAQYAALSAIQLELDRLDGGAQGFIPELASDQDFLYEAGSTYPICNPDGYKYVAAQSANNMITSISVSNELEEGDYIVIDEETAQDLIGLPINL